MAKKKTKKIGLGVKILSEKQLANRYPTAFLASSVDDSKLPRIPTRFLAYNYQIGGGIPYGKIIEIVGEESSGKTLLAYDFAYCTQQLGGIVIWNDAEQSFTNEWALKNDLDLSRVIVNRTTIIEEAADWVAATALYYRSILTHNEPILVVTDSIAALDSADSFNYDMEDGKAEMGNRAKAIYRMVRIRSEFFYRLGITSVYINQLRKKLGVSKFEDPDTTPGGAAMKYFASIRSGFYGARAIVDKNKTKLGRLTTVKVIKNKTHPPKRTISKAPMYYNDKENEIGFDRYFGLADVFEECGVIKNNRGIYKDLKGNIICKGEEKFLKLIEQDDDLRRKLLRKAGINTISTTQRQLDKLNENLFPVTDQTSKYESYSEEETEDDD